MCRHIYYTTHESRKHRGCEKKAAEKRPGKKAEKKNDRWIKGRRQKSPKIFSTASHNPIAYSNMKNNFSPTVNTFVKNFFTLFGLLINLIWINFIGIFGSHKLLMLFEATSISFGRGGAPNPSSEPPAPKPRPGVVALFSISHFYLGIFSLAFLTGHFFRIFSPIP